MQNLPEKQRLVFEALLDNPAGLGLEELAAVLGVTKTAAKEHVVKLLDLGYLAYRDEKGQVGRPKRRYYLTESGHEVFPRQYSWLSSALLGVLATTLGPVEIGRILKRMGADVARSMDERLARAKTPAKRVAEIVAIMSELGYRARLKQSDVRKDVVIEATNCVYHAVAKRHPELCQFDIYLLEAMARSKRVILDSCIARGGSVCRFCIKQGPGA
jgi:predicted ArsR family transcriptional regulator